MEHTNGIYKFENKINHMIYIGQANDLKERYKKHFYNIKDKKHQEDFYIALRQFGWNNFDYEILEEFSPYDYNKERLNKLEIFYIKKFNSLKPNGYNMTKGGNFSGESIKKEISQYSLKGDFIQNYESVLDASRKLDINNSNIIACCRGKRKQAGGFQWKYKEDNKEIIDISLKISQYNIPILQYDIYGNFIAEYNSLDEASQKTNIPKTNICIACKNKSLAYNYQWKYKNDNYIITNLDKTVLQLDKENNIIKEFINATEASKITGIHRGNIGECLKNKRKTAGKYKWIYKKNYSKIIKGEKLNEKDNQ